MFNFNTPPLTNTYTHASPESMCWYLTTPPLDLIIILVLSNIRYQCSIISTSQGQPPDGTVLNLVCKKNLQSKIEFCQAQPQPEMPSFYFNSILLNSFSIQSDMYYEHLDKLLVNLDQTDVWESLSGEFALRENLAIFAIFCVLYNKNA